MAEEKYGIQETKELLTFVFSLAEAIKKSNADGDFNWRDGEAIEVPNVRTVVIFKIEDANKPVDYVPEGCD